MAEHNFKDNPQYQEAVELVRRELRGETVSEAALSDALTRYPEIGRRLQAGTLTPPPAWAKAGLEKMVQLRQTAEAGQPENRDRYMFMLPTTGQSRWQTQPQPPGREWQLQGFSFLAASGVSNAGQEMLLIRVNSPLEMSEEPDLSYEKVVKELGVKVVSGFYERPYEDGWYKVVVQLQSLSQAEESGLETTPEVEEENKVSDYVGWQIHLKTEVDQPALSGVIDEQGRAIFEAVYVPDIDTVETTLQRAD